MSVPRLIPQPPPDVLLPPERLYWALIDLPADVADAATLSRTRRQAIQSLLESQLLPPLDTLTWTATPAGERTLLVCLAPTLEVAAARDRRALRMGPAGLPPTINPAAHVDTGNLNLLTAEFEPLPVARARATFRFVASVLILAATVLLLIGIERRAATLQNDAATRRAQLISQLTTAHAPSLEALLARQKSLRATRHHLEEPPASAAPTTLSSLLAAWPAGASAPIVQVDSLNISPDDIGLQLRARSREDATALAQSLSRLRGWSLVEPQLSTSGITTGEFPVRASFHLRRAPDQPLSGRTEKTP